MTGFMTTTGRALLLMLLSVLGGAIAHAETRYVTERLIVGVYPSPDLAGDRLGQIRSAQAVELLGTEGEAAQIRTEDGLEGWIQAQYLESDRPLAAQVEALEAENAQLRKAQSSAARVDPKPLQKEIADLRVALDDANRRVAELQAPEARAAPPEDEEPVETVRPVRNEALRTTIWLLVVAALALAAGFAWGFRTLDRRIRAKYGGLKVY